MAQTAEDRPNLPIALNPHADTLRAVEAELDRLHPLWRKGKPYVHLPTPEFRAVKVAMKRWARLMKGVDAKVDLVTPDPRNPRRCFAISQEEGDGAPPVIQRGADVAIQAPFVCPAASVLAFDLDLPLERVESALAMLPAEVRTIEAVHAWCRTVDAGVRAALTPRLVLDKS